ncbi:MAG: HNH endonuclease [Proteobacteria bacterium]|nr:MAG: HNH endonuclease [Pseudomonadota bacterium]
MELTFSAEQFEKIKKAQSLISHSVPNNDLAEAVAYLADFLITKKEGKPQIREAVPSKKPTRSFLESRLSKPRRKRKYISIVVRRKLMAEAKNMCTHFDPESNRRCESTFCLQVDHIIPLEFGGSDDIKNLRVLCGFHNRYRASKSG